MNPELFWYIAGALVLAAIVLSAIGIRGAASFPPGNGALAGVIALIAILVVGTTAYAVAYSEDEQSDREHEEAAAEEEQAAEEVAKAPATEGGQAPQPGGAPGGEPAAGPEQTLDLTSPADGSLVFEPDGLEATAGTITLAYDNPSPVPHSVAIEDSEGQVLDESDTVSQSATEATAPLAPGQYVFFCTVPGHREAGMEGDLIVQ